MPSLKERAVSRVWPAVLTCNWRQSTVAVLVVLMMVGPLPGLALCEDRCERGVPLLTHLRVLWSRSFKRVGEKREYACLSSFTPRVSGYACPSFFTHCVSGYACPSSFIPRVSGYACPSSSTPPVSGYACPSSFTPRVSGYACQSSFTYLVCLI